MHPNFLIIGERRCGTTTLYHWLRQHPEIYLFQETDTAYFIDSELVGRTEWLNGKVDPKKWEADHNFEDYVNLFQVDEQTKVIGEKSADIFYWKPAHSRVASYLPNAKFIVQLRDPIFRAWSHYWNEVGKGREKESFEKALQLEEQRCATSDYANHHLSYLRRGFYWESLLSFLEHFPASNLMVLILEETKNQPDQTFERICSFLEIDSSIPVYNPVSKHNDNWTMVRREWANNVPFNYLDGAYNWGLKKVAARLWRNDPNRQVKKRKFFSKTQLIFRREAKQLQMPSSLFKSLNTEYTSHVKKLEEVLGREIKHWRH